MADGLKPVGVQLVAENADQFITQMQSAAKVELEQQTITQADAAALAQLGVNVDNITKGWGVNVEAISKVNTAHNQFVATENLSNEASQSLIAQMMKEAETANNLALTKQTVGKVNTTEFVATENLANEASKSLLAEMMQEAEGADNLSMTKATLAGVTKEGTQAEISQGEARRAGREIMGLMIAEMAIMQLTAGQTNEQMQELGKTLELSLNAGLLTFMATDNLAVAGLVALGAGIAGVAQMAAQADPNIVALNKELDGFSKKDDAIRGLMILTGITEEDAKAALEAAKNNAELASALDQAAQAAERARDPLNSVKVALGDIGGAAVDLAKQLPGISGSLQLMQLGNQLTLASEGVKKTNEELRASIAIGIELDQQQKQAAEDAKNAATQANDLQKMVADDASKMMDLQVTDQDKLAKAARDTTEQIARDNRALQDSLDQISFQRTQIEENNAQQIAQINQSMNDAIENAAEARNNAIERADQSLADREQNIQEQFNNKLDDLAYNQAKKEQANQDEKVKQAKDAADKIADIQRTLLEDLANLDYTTGQDLQKAKTENDKNEIEQRAMHERGVLNQRATDQIDNVQETLAKQQEASQKKQQLDEADYQHQIELAKRTAQQQSEDAQKSYQEQVAQAQKTYAQQVEDAKKRDQEQLANLAIRLRQEEEALDQQVANAKKRNAEQIADLRARLAQEVADTFAAEMKKAEAIAQEISARLVLLGVITQTAKAEAENVTINTEAMRGGGTYVPGMQGQNMTGAAEGMDQVISSPTTIMVAEGYRPERVTVQPLSSSMTHSQSVGTISVIINDATDPQKVWEIFRTRLQQEVFRP